MTLLALSVASLSRPAAGKGAKNEIPAPRENRIYFLLVRAVLAASTKASSEHFQLILRIDVLVFLLHHLVNNIISSITSSSVPLVSRDGEALAYSSLSPVAGDGECLATAIIV